ncbi:MAG: energy transducer TonB, partial [Acidobacteriota bacterium]
ARRITCTSSRYRNLLWDSRAEVAGHKPLPPSVMDVTAGKAQAAARDGAQSEEFDEEQVVKPKKVLTKAPQYAELARLARLQDKVVLQAIIDTEGDVVSIVPLKGMPLCLTEEAVLAVQEWKFEPALYKGEPVSVYYNLTVNFRLQ